jgi:hypothetical protein
MINIHSASGKRCWYPNYSFFCVEQGNASGGMEMDRSLKSLSGGERSFALVSLILSLWTVMTPPFRSV